MEIDSDKYAEQQTIKKHNETTDKFAKIISYGTGLIALIMLFEAYYIGATKKGAEQQLQEILLNNGYEPIDHSKAQELRNCLSCTIRKIDDTTIGIYDADTGKLEHEIKHETGSFEKMKGLLFDKTSSIKATQIGVKNY